MCKLFILTVFIFWAFTTFIHSENNVFYNLNNVSLEGCVESVPKGYALKANNSLSFGSGALPATGDAIIFNGSSWLESDYNKVLNPDGAFSVSVWIKPSSNSGSQDIVSSRESTKGYVLRLQNGQIQLHLGKDGSWNNISGGSITINQWTHVLATFSPVSVYSGAFTGIARIYVNGQLKSSLQRVYVPTAAGKFRVAAGGVVEAVSHYIGAIDELVISDKSFNVLEDLALYFNRPGFISRKLFSNIQSTNLESLTENTAYPFDSDKDDLIPGFQAPKNSGNNYGAIVEAYYTPVLTGDYTFYFSSDDSGLLSISTDRNSLNLYPICSLNSWTHINQFDRYSSQKSVPVSLQAGKAYLLRGIYKEGAGGDHLNVNIQFNGGALQSIDPQNLTPVLFDVETNSEILSESIQVAQTLLEDAMSNIGLIEGTFSEAAIENFKSDIAMASAILADTASTGKDIYKANWNLIEKIKAFSELKPQKLYGEIIGSEPAWREGREYDKAFDGRTDTFVDTLFSSGWTGIKLENEEKLVKFRFYPRKNLTGRMKGAKIQGSNDGSNWVTLYTISSNPALKWNEVHLNLEESYSQFRIYFPKGYTNIAELEFYSFHTPELVMANHKPQPFEYNKADQAVKPKYLRAEHGGLYHKFITYKLTLLPKNGVLKLGETALHLGDIFTQEDIDNGSLTFSHDISLEDNHDSQYFAFDVSDIIGGELTEQFFQIHFDSDFDGLTDNEEIALSLDWQNSDTDGDTLSDLWEVENGTDPKYDVLNPEITRIQGENGLMAAYWYDSLTSLSSYGFKRGPNEIKKISRIAFNNGTGKAVGSTKNNYVAAKFSGYLFVPKTGEYKFDLISDDGSKLSIDGATIISNDGVHSARLKSGSKHLEAGFRRIEVQYFEAAGSHVCLLYWEGSGVEKSLIPAQNFYLSIPEFEELKNTVDRDGDFLTDVLEEENGTDSDNPDSDGDRLLDGEEFHAHYNYKTDPLNVDTDDDKVSDYDEIFIYKSNPLVPDFNGEQTLVESIIPSSYTTSLGEWIKQGDYVYAKSVRGQLDYDVTLENGGVFVLEMTVTQQVEESVRNIHPLQVFVDGEYVEHYFIKAAYGSDVKKRIILPYLTPGDHVFRIRNDNVFQYNSVLIKKLDLVVVHGVENGANWVDHYLTSTCSFKNEISKSKVSPVCIEGTGKYLSMMSVSGEAKVNRGNHNHWYTNAELKPYHLNEIEVSWQSGARKEKAVVEWEETNVLDGGSFTIRKGDSLLLNCLKNTDEDLGAYSLVNVDGSYNIVGPGEGYVHQFNEAGVFEVKGYYINGDGEKNQSIFIKVVEVKQKKHFPLWRFKERAFQWDGLPSEVILEGDGMAKFDKKEDGSYILRRDGYHADFGIVARLGENGPIISTVKTPSFYIYELVEGYTFKGEVYEDGTWRIQDTIFISHNFPAAVDIEMHIFVSGVTTMDGDTRLWLKKSDFDELGQYEFSLLKAADRVGSACHRLKAWFEEAFIGQRR